MKCCRICGEDKDITLFHKRPGSKDGHRNECMGCQNARNRKYWKEAGRKHTLKAHNAHLIRTYGISFVEYTSLLTQQNGVCSVIGVILRWVCCGMIREE